VGEHLALEVTQCGVVAVGGEVIASGITTIVTSSTAARLPMPLRLATSPSKSVALSFSTLAAGVDSV